MTLVCKKSFWMPGLLSGLIFLTLFSFRLGLWEMLNARPQALTLASTTQLADKNNWMSIYQDERKIGYAHKRLVRLDNGYRIEELVLMRINTMGLVQEVRLNTTGNLNPDFTIASFDFQIHSGRFKYRVLGKVEGRNMSVTTAGGGTNRTFDYTLEQKPYLVAGILDVIRKSDLKPGKHWTFHIFDPGTLGQAPLTIEIIGNEMHHQREATRVLLTFKGTTQLVWLDDNGDIIQEEGLLGIRMVKSDRADALSGISEQPGRDLTQVASVAVNRSIADPAALQQMKVIISGVPLDNVHVKGGRQSLEGRTLTIGRESVSGLPQKLYRDDLAHAGENLFKSQPVYPGRSP